MCLRAPRSVVAATGTRPRPHRRPLRMDLLLMGAPDTGNHLLLWWRSVISSAATNQAIRAAPGSAVRAAQ